MNDPSGNIDFEELLARVIAGEADADERAQLERAIASSDQLRRQFERSRVIWEKSVTTKSRPTFDTEAAWQKVSQRINKAEDGDKIRKLGSQQNGDAGTVNFPTTNSGAWTWRIAASVIGLAGLAAFIYLLTRPPIEPVMLTASAVKIESTLPDGSAVALNANSTLSYPKEFDAKQRRVKLKGEAYFKVTPDKEKPFIVEAESAVITVVGTAFNVTTRGEKVEVKVAEGVVRLAPLNLDSSFVLLRAGEMGVYDRSTGMVQKAGAVNPNDLYWTTGRLIFDNKSLEEVVSELNKAYGSNIKLQNDSIADCRITTSFQNDSLPAVLRVIALTLDLEIIPQSNQILLDGKGCQ